MPPGVEGEHDSLPVNLLSDDHSTPEAPGRHRILLEAYGYRWYRVGGMECIFRRTAF